MMNTWRTQARTFRFNLFGLRGPFAKLNVKWMTVLRTSIEPAEGQRVELLTDQSGSLKRHRRCSLIANALSR
jgi:hypothetical protein